MIFPSALSPSSWMLHNGLFLAYWRGETGFTDGSPCGFFVIFFDSVGSIESSIIHTNPAPTQDYSTFPPTTPQAHEIAGANSTVYRATAATAMNEVSSRSHAIFTIYITVTFTTKLSNGTGKGVRPENGVTGDDVR